MYQSEVELSQYSLVLLAAGNSTRFGHPYLKQWLRSQDDPLWLIVTNLLKSCVHFDKIIIATNADAVDYMQRFCDETVVAGGESRQASLSNALQHVHSDYVIVSDVARSCVNPKIINQLIEKRHEADVIVPALDVHDTTTLNNQTIKREALKRIQTPQLSNTTLLKKALLSEAEYTDESSAIVAIGGTRAYIKGDMDAQKITYEEDLKSLSCLQPPAPYSFNGIGLDVHAFTSDKEMKLCGVTIPSQLGFEAHSDGDVAIHALIDALFGAAGLDDIGTHFPDSDTRYKNIDSAQLLLECCAQIRKFGFEISNIDLSIAAQYPKISPHKALMRKRLAELLGIKEVHVNIKATTTEKLGFVGRKEGVAVLASATLHYFNWKEL